MGFVDFSALATVMRTLKFSKPQGAPARYPPAPDGFTVYVVGDIHGRLDLLLEVQRRIDEDKARLVRGRAVEVYLGDYIDRGPDPAGVVSRLIDRARSVHTVFLRGNHEQLLLDFLDGNDCLDQWLAVGGNATMLSYGLALGPPSRLPAGVVIRRELGQAIPREHRQFYEKTGSWIRLGGYLAVHAGIRPGVPLEEQQPADLLGIRQRFLQSEGEFGFVVVHGHTPVMAPELLPNRINIDTGAFATNLLTCLKIDAEGARVLPVGGLEAHSSHGAPVQARKSDDAYSILGVRRGASRKEVRVSHLREVIPSHPKSRVEDPIAPARPKVICGAYQALKGFRARRLPRKAEPRTTARRPRAFFAIGFLASSTSVLLVLFVYYLGSLLPLAEKSVVAAKPKSVATGLTPTISQHPAEREEGREIAWTEAERTGSREAWQRFLEMYPEGDRAVKALQALASIDAALAQQHADHAAWAEAEKSGGTAALQWYLANYTSGDHAAEAKRRLALVEEEDQRAQDDVAWSKAVLGNSSVSYAAYLSAHPHGRHSADARSRMDKLERLEAPAAAVLKDAKPAPQAARGAPGPAAQWRPSPDEPFVGADVRIRR